MLVRIVMMHIKVGIVMLINRLDIDISMHTTHATELSISLSFTVMMANGCTRGSLSVLLDLSKADLRLCRGFSAFRCLHWLIKRLTVINASIWVHHIETWMALLVMRHISVHETGLSAVERRMMLLVLGLLNQEIVEQGSWVVMLDNFMVILVLKWWIKFMRRLHLNVCNIGMSVMLGYDGVMVVRRLHIIMRVMFMEINWLNVHLTVK